MRLEEAIASIETCATEGALMHSLQRICEDYGFSSFNFLETGAPHLDVPFFMGTMETEFSKDYFDNKLIHSDPCISHARRMNSPFTWADVPFADYDAARKSGAQRTIEVAGDHGYQEGLIVPFHFSDRLGRINSCLIVFFWKDEVSRFYFTLGHKKYDLHLIMIYWAQRMVDLVAERFHGKKREQETIGKRRCFTTLTDRERDVLSWAARGKTAVDTADILQLSEETIKTHIRNALGKLDATNKTHGVAKAIFLGLIDV